MPAAVSSYVGLSSNQVHICVHGNQVAIGVLYTYYDITICTHACPHNNIFVGCDDYLLQPYEHAINDYCQEYTQELLGTSFDVIKVT